MAEPPSPALSTLSLAATVAPPNMDNVHDLMAVMKTTMDALGGTFEALNSTSQRVEELQNEPALDAVKQISDLRKQLVKRDRRQETKMQEIEQLLREVLQHEIVEYLKGQIADQIEEVIAAEVEAQVALQLNRHIPPTIQESFAANQRQLDEVQFTMKNAEARRANGQLRANNLQGPMHQMLPPSGTIPENFPDCMSTLLAMDGEQVISLLEHYELTPASTREENLNKFMRYCNIGYQVVPMEPTLAVTA